MRVNKVQRRCFKTRKGHIERISAELRMRHGIFCFVAGLRRFVKRRAAGIRHTDHAGDLVKALPCRIVAGRAHDVKFCVILHVNNQRMPSGDDEAKKRRLQIGIRQIIGRDMPPDMVNRNERHAEAVRRRFREIHTHQHRADQPRRIRHGNRVDLLPRYGRAGKRLVCQRVNCFNMLARGQLRHNTAVKPVQCDL